MDALTVYRKFLESPRIKDAVAYDEYDDDEFADLSVEDGTGWSAIEDHFYHWGEDDGLRIFDGFTAQIVQQKGGEGEGDEYYIVFEVVSADGVQYFRKDGFYASYEGTSWDYEPFREVKPVDRVVRFYE